MPWKMSNGSTSASEPGHFMYSHLSKEKIDRIIEEHILGGNPVEEYLIPSQYWGEAVNLAK